MVDKSGREDYDRGMKTRHLPLLIFLLFLFFPTSHGRAQSAARPELRAFWADGFNDGYKTPEQVDLLLGRLHDAHCNAIFAQMRKGGDAYYASHYEPWANDDTGRFDALAYLIEHAHAMQPRIAVHAWINTCAVGKGMHQPQHHVAQLHPEYLSVNAKNNPDDNEAYKIDPGNPDAADWTFRIYLDVVRHYPVDGIHFDFVRYGRADWGYNPVSVARFQALYRNRSDIARIPGSDLPIPKDPTWKQWRRDQVTALVRKVYAHAIALNPNVVVSAAVITWGDGPHQETDWYTKSAAMNRVYQDWRSWLQEGMIDLACPMTYFQAGSATQYQVNWSEWIKNHQYKRAATVAIGNWMNTIPDSLALMQIARSPSRKGRLPYGIMLYSYAGTNASVQKSASGSHKELQYQPEFYNALGQPAAASGPTTVSAGAGDSSAQGPANSGTPPFPTDVPIPAMDWKTHPRTGIVKGFLLTPALDPIDGAEVTVEGHGRRWKGRTDGTGFYAAIALPAGDYRVSISAAGYAKQRRQTKILAGAVTTEAFTVGSASISMADSIAALEGRSPNSFRAAEGTPVRLQNLMVSLGSDTYPGNLYVLDPKGGGVRVRLATIPPLPFQPGDIVSVVGLWRSIEGEPAIDASRVRLTDIAPSSAQPAAITPTGEALKTDTAPIGSLVQVKGTVTASSFGGFVLDESGTRIDVPSEGLKESGVEATKLDLTPPPVGTLVSVTGILGIAPGGDAKGLPPLRILLRAGTDVRNLPLQSTWMRYPWALGLLAILLPALVALRSYKRKSL